PQAVLVRGDGSGVCVDGRAHAWRQTYPPAMWAVACVCCVCCGPLYCYRHPQLRCTRCSVVIQHPAN
ncbi:hypothetical protein LPJ63_001491, partial [Coemansia sp. RSA 2711]